ncbi:MAG: hypothetical protein Q9190_006037 [Brigantiaea leucoxantha]
MVYVGIGILVVSLSFFCYKFRVLSWSPRSVKAPPEIRTEDFDSSEKGDGDLQAHRNGLASLQRPIEATRADCEPPTNNPSALALRKELVLGHQEAKGNQPVRDEERENAELQSASPTQGTIQRSTSTSVKAVMPPPPRPSPNAKRKPPAYAASTSLTQAPSTPSSTSLRAPPSISGELRPPPSAASTLRTPLSRSSIAPSSLAPTSSTLPSAKRPSRKVLLDPGHSPLDWANLVNNPATTTLLRGPDVPSHLIRVPPSLLRYHNGRKGKNAWGVWQGKVYNLTPYMKFHPGGVDELMKGAGRERDAERLFLEVHPWVNWDGILGECLVGILVGEEEMNAAVKQRNDLEALD